MLKKLLVVAMSLSLATAGVQANPAQAEIDATVQELLAVKRALINSGCSEQEANSKVITLADEALKQAAQNGSTTLGLRTNEKVVCFVLGVTAAVVAFAGYHGAVWAYNKWIKKAPVAPAAPAAADAANAANAAAGDAANAANAAAGAANQAAAQDQAPAADAPAAPAQEQAA